MQGAAPKISCVAASLWCRTSGARLTFCQRCPTRSASSQMIPSAAATFYAAAQFAKPSAAPGTPGLSQVALHTAGLNLSLCRGVPMGAHGAALSATTLPKVCAQESVYVVIYCMQAQ